MIGALIKFAVEITKCRYGSRGPVRAQVERDDHVAFVRGRLRFGGCSGKEYVSMKTRGETGDDCTVDME